jgi:hypothetical protein
MLKIILNNYLLDFGLNVLFDGIYKNMIAPTLTPVIEGSNMRIDTPSYSLLLHDVTGDVGACVQLGQEIMIDIMYMEMDAVEDYIYDKYNIISELKYK